MTGGVANTTLLLDQVCHARRDRVHESKGFSGKVRAWLDAHPAFISNYTHTIPWGAIRWNAGTASSPGRPSAAVAFAVCAACINQFTQQYNRKCRPSPGLPMPIPSHLAEARPILFTYFGGTTLEIER